jgi:penicillin-binding protein 2
MAMVSFPSFDNNDFIESLSEDEYNRYFEDQNKPMFNRIISGRYNPGSTIKPLIALAALEEGIIDPDKIILSTGQITIANQYNPEIVYVFHDWKPLGWVDMKTAIAMSSNIYFYHLGGGYDDVEGLGLERIRKYMKFFLINDVLEIDLGPESAGFIPSAEWKEETFGEPWYKGDTFNITVGQGDLLVTPLWLNSFTAAIANGGTIYKPQIVQSIIDEDKNVIKKFEPEILTKLPFSPGSFDIVREGMHEVTLTGTARSLANMSVSAGAKSGTAQLGSGIKRVNSFFNVYAPFEDPEIVITILIEEPKNPNLANGVAKEVIEWYFGQSKENMIE